MKQAAPALVTPGPLARHPRDLDLLLTALTTPAPAEETPWHVDLPTASKGIKELRIAIWAEDPNRPVDHETAHTLITLEEALIAAGALVRHTPGPVGFADSTRLFEKLLHATATATTNDETAATELAATRQLQDTSCSAAPGLT
ncbi:hypothetical protein ACIBMX_46655 [Streptomyces phaeochromogenes]|uniref:hypothetical protein n=1 Tax=Streptomyces phaeochromogenes TaxID=1923 RepID=UPI00340DF24D